MTRAVAPEIPLDCIVGVGEIRRLAGGVSRTTLKRWRDDHEFPEPVKSIDAGELWDRREVTDWLERFRAAE